MNIENRINLTEYSVWDLPTRLFHWINALAVICLIGIGLVIFNSKSLGISGDGKILLKTIHVYIGYVFILNLIWRFIWAFLGNRYAKWRAVLPGGRGYGKTLRTYVKQSLSGQPTHYLGHNPLGKIMVATLLLLLTAQGITGLVLAGTDLYMPPFGHQIAEWVAAGDGDPDKIAELKPGSKANINEAAYADMRAFRKPFITLHKVVFYLLCITIALHIIAVIFTEIREKSNLISAMFTGRKIFSSPPVDAEKQ